MRTAILVLVLLAPAARAQKPLVYASRLIPGQFAAGAPVVGDFNGDGKLDLVSAAAPGLLLGAGDGTFSPGPALPVFGRAIASAGSCGVLSACRSDSSERGIHRHSHQSRRRRLQRGNRPPFAGCLRHADRCHFGGKGVASLLSAGSSTAIWLGNGDGTFTLQTGLPFLSYHPVVADFNGDGLPDIAAVIETNGTH